MLAKVLARVVGALCVLSLCHLAIWTLRRARRSVPSGTVEPALTITREPDPGVVGRIVREARAVDDVLREWGEHLLTAGRRPGSIQAFRSRVRIVCKDLGWTAPAQFNARELEAYFAQRQQAARESGSKRLGRGSTRWSSTTQNMTLSALRRFMAFAVARAYVESNPFAGMTPTRGTVGAGSRAATVEEARALIRSAYSAHQRRAVVSQRWAFYALLFLTGLRQKELASIRWCDLELDAETPFFRSDPAWSKTRKLQFVALAPEAVTVFRALAERRGSANGEATVFEQRPSQAAWARDLRAAGVRDTDQRGRKLTAHGARKSLATWLDRLGTPAGIVAQITRHADGITQERYIDADTKTQAQYLRALPKILPDWDDKGLDPTPDPTDTHGVTAGPHPQSKPTTAPLPAVTSTGASGVVLHAEDLAVGSQDSRGETPKCEYRPLPDSSAITLTLGNSRATIEGPPDEVLRLAARLLRT